MKRILPLFLALTHLGVGPGPVFDARAAAATDEPGARAGLEKRLRGVDHARVWIAQRATPGGQMLVQPDWLLVRSPRVTPEGLRFSSVVVPDSLRVTGFTWEEVDEIHVRVNNTGSGALVGGMMGAAAVGAMAVALSDFSSDTEAGEIVGALALAFTIGAFLGAVVGSQSRHWVSVYP